MQVSKLNDCIEVRYTYKTGFNTQCLLLSDTHIDSKKAKKKQLKEHLEEAANNQRPIFFFGDVFDAMGHDRDPRSGKSDVLPEYQVTEYFDSLLDKAVEFLKPYAEWIVLLAEGNHETNVTKRYGTDLLKRLCMRLELETKHKIYFGRSDGWVRFVFAKPDGGSVLKKTLFYNHFNNGGKRSKGVLGADLRQADIEADIYVTGHIHTKWNLPLSKLVLDKKGNEKVKDILHIQSASYKDSSPGGWERTKNHYAATIGGWWLDFTHKVNKIKVRAIDLV